MSDLQNTIQYMFKDIDRLLEINKKYMEIQNNSSNKFLNIHAKTKDNTALAVGLSVGNDALIHYYLYQTISLLKLNIAVTKIIYDTLEKLENEFSDKIKEIKSELGSQVKNTLDPIKAGYEQNKKNDEEVNKAAKEREKYIDDMFG